MTADDYVESIKSAFISLGTNAILAALAESVPFTNIPILRSIIRYLVSYALTLLAKDVEMEVFFIYTDFRTNGEAKDFEAAALANAKAQATGTPEEKLNAEKLLIDKFTAFARISS